MLDTNSMMVPVIKGLLIVCLGGNVLKPSRGSFIVSYPKSHLSYLPRITETNVAAQNGFGSPKDSNGTKKRKRKSPRLIDSLSDDEKKSGSKNMPFVRSEQENMLASLALKASTTVIGRAVANSPLGQKRTQDPFWELMPSLLSSRFPNTPDQALERVAGFVRHTLDPTLPLEKEILENPFRPENEIHAYMPGLGPTKPFHDTNQLQVCRDLQDNFEIIRGEYDALIRDMETGGKDRFQSVTSMNYDSGWKTLVLFYNGHRIEGFPYHLCPTTTRILETVPIAGRIAGFNRQQPLSGIPLHTDGNNMWLTCQMGVYVPEGQKAYISVGSEKRYWKEGECIVYDTTYKHYTMNEHETKERVVLHVDFFNTLVMTPVEIEVLQYIYQLREQFMKAEGIAKVGAQIL